MKVYSEFALTALLIGMLFAIDTLLGRRVMLFAAGVSSVWFLIAIILLSRPPGIPEFVSEEMGSDEQYVVRKDVIPRLPWLQRFRLSLSVACGSCLLLWLSLTLMGR